MTTLVELLLKADRGSEGLLTPTILETIGSDRRWH